ncbi:NACHT domain-containing protein [Streptomyces sp. NPDC007346]|uniref:NACHT domain-containing protein n=1 Tax=Streptomyces sp. NPDC007346 TaxID=3154682 RepID=UPI0034515809
MAGGGGGRAAGDDGLHQEISGGTQQNVIFAQVIENVSLHGEHDLRAMRGAGGRDARRGLGTAVLPSAVALLGVFLLLARPELPLPAGLDPGPVAGGWSLLVGAVGYAVWSRVRRERARRRLATWHTRRNLARATEALAEGLALRYDEDERLTRINDPYPLDVAWTTPQTETDEAAGRERKGPEAEEPPPSARPAPPDIADHYSATPARRLVVLGGAGAGKSVLVLRLAHALLHRRAKGSGDPVPMVVSLASWDPGQGLLRWMANQLADAYPEACTPVPEAPAADVAFHLLLTGRVLPVLDGFDELPEDRRAAAFHQISRTMRGRRPFVLASREPEYREHAPDEADFERTEIRLSPLDDATVRAYLGPGRTRTRWTTVLDRLADHSSDAPPEVRRLREVLSVPLMANLARVAYAHTTADPSELLEPDVFGSRADIERHLYDAFLDAVYSSSHDIQAAYGGWSPQQARTWVGYLAARMKAANEQDLAWWRLEEALPRVVAVLVLVPALLVGSLAVSGLAFGLPWWRLWLPWPSPLGAYMMLCGLVLVAEAAVRTTGRQELPRRLHRPDREDVRGEFTRWPGRVRAALSASAIVATGAAALRWGGGWSFLFAYSCGAVAWWYGRRILGRVWRSADPALADTPAALLRADRRGVLTLGWFASLRSGNEATPLRYRLARTASAGVVARPRPTPGRVRRTVAMALVLAVSGGQLVVGSGVMIAERLPGPVRSLPAACALLDPKDLDRLTEDHSQVGAADGASCSVDEQAPFSRNVSIGVSRILAVGDGIGISGPERAQTFYVERRSQAGNTAKRYVSDDGFPRDLDGLGHEAYVAAWTGTVAGRVEGPRATARVGVRSGNAVILLDYAEEFASLDRAAEIAQVLARKALHRAGLAGFRPRGRDPQPIAGGATTPAVDRPLTSVAPRRAPSAEDHRFVFYDRRRTGSVYGATWQGDERSYLWNLHEVHFVFRAPKHMECGFDGYLSDHRTYTCTAVPDDVEAGLLPELRLEIRSLYCGQNCTGAQTAAFLRAIPGHAATTWTRHNERAYYATDFVGDDSYRLAMKRIWAWQNKSEGIYQAYLLWVRVEVPSEHRALAQKIVNDMYAQTGAAEILRFG